MGHNRAIGLFYADMPTANSLQIVAPTSSACCARYGNQVVLAVKQKQIPDSIAASLQKE